MSVFLGGEKSGIELAFGPVHNQIAQASQDAGLDHVQDEVSNVFSYTFLNLIALVFIWMGVMVALKVEGITNSVLEPFNQFSKGVSGLVKQMPQMMPIPTGNGKSMQLGALSKIPGEFTGALQGQISTSVRGVRGGIDEVFNRIGFAFLFHDGLTDVDDFRSALTKAVNTKNLFGFAMEEDF